MDGIKLVTNQINFEDTPEFKKGKEGEDMIISLFKFLGYYITDTRDYSKRGAPQCRNDTEGLTLPDILISKNGKSYYIEVKRKTTREKYPDTGFPKRNYDHYIKVQKETGIPIFIIFIDDGALPGNKNYINTKNTIYGNFLDKLSCKICEYPKVTTRGALIIYFKYPEHFIKICDLNILITYKNNAEKLKNIISDIFK